MKHILISISLLYLGIYSTHGHSLSKVELKQPSNLIYKVTEENNGRSLVISNPHPEKPTLREIIYYHIFEKPYNQDGAKDTSAVSLDFDDTLRPFTNGQGFQYLDQPASNDNELKGGEEPEGDQIDKSTDVPNDVDISPGNAVESTTEAAEATSQETETPISRRKRDTHPKWSHRNKRRTRGRLPKGPFLSKLDLSRLPKMVKQLLTNAKLDNKDASPEVLNDSKPQEAADVASKDDKSYGMDLIGDAGIVWNKLKNPKYAYLVGSIISQLADRTALKDTANSESDSDESNSSGVSSNESSGSNESPESTSGSAEDISSNESPENSASASSENSQESLENSNSGSAESGSSSIESGSGSDESSCDSASGSNEDSSSDEDEGSGSSEIESLESNKDEDSNELGSNEDSNSKFNELLDKLHNIFVENNSSIVVKPDDSDKPLDDFLDIIHNLFNNTKIENFSEITTKKPKNRSLLTILEGFFTKIIKNNIIINNNVPEKPSNVLPQKDKSEDPANPSTTEIPNKDSTDTTEEPHTNADTATTFSPSTIEDLEITTINNENGLTTEREDEQYSEPSEENEPSSTSEEPDNGPEEETPDDGNSSKIEDDVTTTSSIPDEYVDENDTQSNTTPDDNDANQETTEIPDEHVDGDDISSNVVPDNTEGNDNKYTTESTIPDENLDKDDTPSNLIPDDNEGIDNKLPETDTTEEPPKESKPTDGEEKPPEENGPQNNVDLEKDKESNNKSPAVEQKIDYMLDLMNNEKFWTFMGDLAGKYLDSLMARTKSLIKEEIKYQMREYLDAVNKLDDKLEKAEKTAEKIAEERKKHKDKEIEITTKIPEKADDKEKLNVKAKQIYGNTVGNDKVTNVYIFYPNKNMNEIIKQIKEIANKNNSTNIFTFGPHDHKHSHTHLNKDKDTAKPDGNHDNNVEPTDIPSTNSTPATDSNEETTEATTDFNTDATDVTQPTETHSTVEVTSEANVNTATPDITTEGKTEITTDSNGPKDSHTLLNKDKDAVIPDENNGSNVKPTDIPSTNSTPATDINEETTESNADFNTDAKDVTQTTETETDSTAEVTSEANVNTATPDITTEEKTNEITTESSTPEDSHTHLNKDKDAVKPDENNGSNVEPTDIPSTNSTPSTDIIEETTKTETDSTVEVTSEANVNTATPEITTEVKSDEITTESSTSEDSHTHLNKDKDIAMPDDNHDNNVEQTDIPSTNSTPAIEIETDSTVEITSEAYINTEIPEKTTERKSDEIATESSTAEVTGEVNTEPSTESADTLSKTTEFTNTDHSERTEGIFTEITTETNKHETTVAIDLTTIGITEEVGTGSTTADSTSDGVDLTSGDDKVTKPTTADVTDKIVLTDATTTEEASTVGTTADDVQTEATVATDEIVTESIIDDNSTKITESSTVEITTELSSSIVTEETTITAINDTTNGETTTANPPEEVKTETPNSDITSELTSDLNTESTTAAIEVTTTINEDLTSEPTTLGGDDISSTGTTVTNKIEDVPSTETTTDKITETSTISQDVTDVTQPTSEVIPNKDQENDIKPNADENPSQGVVTIEKDEDDSTESSVHIEPNDSSADNDSGHVGEVTIGKGSSEEEIQIQPAPDNKIEKDDLSKQNNNWPDNKVEIKESSSEEYKEGQNSEE